MFDEAQGSRLNWLSADSVIPRNMCYTTFIQLIQLHQSGPGYLQWLTCVRWIYAREL